MTDVVTGRDTGIATLDRIGRHLITAVIHTKDEERNVERAITSVRPHVRDVLVVDMASDDRTVEIATSMGATVLPVPDFGYMEPARALAMAAVETPWVLVCDADEVIPATLGLRLREIAADDSADVVYLHARTFMFGAEIVGSGWSRSAERHPKFYKRDTVRDFDDIHRRPEVIDSARVLDLGVSDEMCYLHFNYTDLSHFVAKLDRYTSAEVLKPGASLRVASRITKEIGWRFVAQRAWRDGYRGLLLVHLMVAYRLLAYGKARVLRECGPEEDILDTYDRIAASVTVAAVRQ